MKLVSYSSTISMMHGPIYIRFIYFISYLLDFEVYHFWGGGYGKSLRKEGEL